MVSDTTFYRFIQEVRKNVICYTRPVVGWWILAKISTKSWKKIFLTSSNFNEKLKGVVKKDKKIEYSKYKNPSCEAIFVIIFNAMRKKTQSQSTWLMNAKFSYMYVSLYYAYSHLSVSIWLISCQIYHAQPAKCDYFWDFSKTKTISNPCQNRPTECSECQNLVWSYNMKEHYRIFHPEIQTCLHEISQEEIKKVLQS